MNSLSRSVRFRTFALLIYCLLLIGLPEISQAQNETTTVAIAAVETAAENEVTVQVRIETAENARFAAGAFSITYNASALQPVECLIQSDFLGVCNTDRSGEILFNALNAQGFSGSSILAELLFIVKDVAPVDIGLRMTDPAVNELGEPISAVVDRSTVDVLNKEILQNKRPIETTELSTPQLTETPEISEESAATATPLPSLTQAAATNTITVQPTNTILSATPTQPVEEPSPTEAVAQISTAEVGSTSTESTLDPPTIEPSDPNLPPPSPVESVTEAINDSDDQIAEVESEAPTGEIEADGESTQLTEVGRDVQTIEESSQTPDMIDTDESASANQLLWIGFVASCVLFIVAGLGFVLMARKRSKDR